MAQNQTDTGQSRLLALTPKRPLPKTVELKHVFSPDTTGTTGGEISCATTIPKFNLDLTFFTPAFVLGTDQVQFTLDRTIIASTNSSSFRNLSKEGNKHRLTFPTP